MGPDNKCLIGKPRTGAMKKCDCLNFCGDDTSVDSYSESCVNYHHRRVSALKWLADYVPCWEPNATQIMRCDWHPVGYLFFAEETTKNQGFVFSLAELNRERVRIGKSEFTDLRQRLEKAGRPQGQAKVTSEIKAECIGEFSWQEEAPYYDENGEVIEHTATHVVPWDLCKKIYRRMAALAERGDE